MGHWYVMYSDVYVMYCNVEVGLIILNNTRSKRVNENMTLFFTSMLVEEKLSGI